MSQECGESLARRTMERALKAGADQAAVRVGQARFVSVEQRAGKVESLQASTSQGLTLELYADGRYSSNRTSFLEPAALETFVEESLALTRRLAPDEHRGLADPALCGQAETELDLDDGGGYDALGMDRRKELVAEAEAVALERGGEALISVTVELTTQARRAILLHSDGFAGQESKTSFYLGASVAARDQGDRRAEDAHWVGACHLRDLPSASSVGEEAARRALSRVGASKARSTRCTAVVENRAAGKLISALLGPLSGASLQQRRSCFEGAIGQVIAASRLTIHDEPLIPRGLGSRTFDGDGLLASTLPIISQGKLGNYFIDVYYGRKLGMPPTTGSASNVVVALGDRSADALIADVGDGILITGFLGGNSNTATGDFSFGVSGFEIKGGVLGAPINEMNIADNIKALWQRLVDLGDDPYPYSSLRVPTLVFSDVQFSGS